VNASCFKTRNDEEKVRLVANAINKIRVGSRIVTTSFPENENQAYLFSKNYQPPINVVFVEKPFNECLENESNKPEESRRSVVSMLQHHKKVIQNKASIKAF